MVILGNRQWIALLSMILLLCRFGDSKVEIRSENHQDIVHLPFSTYDWLNLPGLGTWYVINWFVTITQDIHLYWIKQQSKISKRDSAELRLYKTSANRTKGNWIVLSRLRMSAHLLKLHCTQMLDLIFIYVFFVTDKREEIIHIFAKTPPQNSKATQKCHRFPTPSRNARFTLLLPVLLHHQDLYHPNEDI